MGSDDKMYDILFNMKFAAKQLNKSASAAEKASEKEKNNIKKALEKGNPEAARIYAENAVRKRNESLNYLRLSSRLDAAASRVQTAMQMKEVSKAMQSTVKGMDKILASMDPMKITKVMDEFESKVGTLDVNIGTMDAAFESTSAGVIPVGEVDTLLEQVAAANNIEVSNQLAGGPLGSRIGQPSQRQETSEDELAKLLSGLQPLS